jgi:DNA-binding beta-propeller fold protein YncE
MNSISVQTELQAPRIDEVVPAAALPLGEVELRGAHLGPVDGVAPQVQVAGEPALLTMSRPRKLSLRVPYNAQSGLVEVSNAAGMAALPLRVARLLSDGLHPVTSPAVSRSGMIYTTISGTRGKETPVSVVRVSQDGRGIPFVSGILNATGLAFSPEGELFVTSRAEGTVYRIDASGEATVYAEGMGVATGAVFDAQGNLFVGDRSGTIFKIDAERRIFVHTTLEASVSAYHLAMGPTGTLFVTGPTLGSNDAIWAIESDGEAREWYRGLGRPQGLAVCLDGNVYVAACLAGQRGLVRVTPQGDASLALAGTNLAGVAFSPLGSAILTTNEAVYDVDLGVNGMCL